MSRTKTAVERVTELRFLALPARMALVREWVREAADECGLSETEAEDIVLAIGEACQNVMRHGYPDGEPGDIVLSISWSEDGIVVKVTDFAPTIDPDAIRSRDLDDLRPGGLGMHFINSLMDTVEFLPGPAGVGNVLRMTRKTGVSE